MTPRRRYPPTLVGAYTSDESVYGMRDLEASVQEYTSSFVKPGFVSRRGGSWNTPAPGYYRIPSRNSRVPHGRGSDTGFRLVAEHRD